MTDYKTFVRRPFPVKALLITKDNIVDLAPQIGELQYKDDDPDQPYIQVDRKKVPSVFRVWPGYFLTKMGDNVRCYSPKVFKQQFVADSPEIQEWVTYLAESDGEASEGASQAVREVEVAPGVTVGQEPFEVHIFDGNDVEEAGLKTIQKGLQQHSRNVPTTPGS